MYHNLYQIVKLVVVTEVVRVLEPCKEASAKRAAQAPTTFQRRTRHQQYLHSNIPASLPTTPTYFEHLNLIMRIKSGIDHLAAWSKILESDCA